MRIVSTKSGYTYNASTDLWSLDMLRKAFRTGNSIVVALPKEAVELLGLAEGKEVSLEVDREKRQIILSPVEASLATTGVDREFARQVSEFIEEYRSALETLAKK